MILAAGKVLLTPNHAYIKYGNSIRDLTLDTNTDTVYTHPSYKVCNYSIDTSSFATRSELTTLQDKVNSMPSVPRAIASGNVIAGGRYSLSGAAYVTLTLESTTSSISVAPTSATIVLGNSLSVSMYSSNRGWGYTISFVDSGGVPTLSCGSSSYGVATMAYVAYAQ